MSTGAPESKEVKGNADDGHRCRTSSGHPTRDPSLRGPSSPSGSRWTGGSPTLGGWSPVLPPGRSPGGVVEGDPTSRPVSGRTDRFGWKNYPRLTAHPQPFPGPGPTPVLPPPPSTVTQKSTPKRPHSHTFVIRVLNHDYGLGSLPLFAPLLLRNFLVRTRPNPSHGPIPILHLCYSYRQGNRKG